jgi:hypothetical protein
MLARVQSLAYQRCFNHSAREAVARCRECRNYFCRECVTEHDERMICAPCLRKLAARPLTQRRGFLSAVRAVQLCAGVLLAWLFFYWGGQFLLDLPSSFHDGTVWKGTWMENP